MFSSIDELQQALEKEKYICDRSLATVLFLALKLEKPILLEGEAGVGKTEVAKVMTQALGRRLIRLQCYEGLDVTTALYEWNYPKQLLRIKMGEAGKQPLERVENIFSEEFLIARPLLEAIQSEASDQHIVLLIDEVDRSDEEFEAFLLEILSDFQITIPEIGTISAKHRPLVIITSNRTREIHDALKRRCLYHWIDYPSFEKEYRIVTTQGPCHQGNPRRADLPVHADGQGKGLLQETRDRRNPRLGERPDPSSQGPSGSIGGGRDTGMYPQTFRGCEEDEGDGYPELPGCRQQLTPPSSHPFESNVMSPRPDNILIFPKTSSFFRRP